MDKIVTIRGEIHGEAKVTKYSLELIFDKDCEKMFACSSRSSKVSF